MRKDVVLMSLVVFLIVVAVGIIFIKSTIDEGDKAQKIVKTTSHERESKPELNNSTPSEETKLYVNNLKLLSVDEALDQLKQALLREESKISREKGVGTITGRITTEDDIPLSDITVKAQRLIDGGRHFYRRIHQAEQEELGKRLDSWMEIFMQNICNAYQTYTDAEGKYVLNELPGENRYRMTAVGEGYEIIPNNKQYSVKPDAEVNFTARLLLTVPVRIVLPDGSSPDLATLRIRSFQARFGFRGNYQEWSKEKNTVELAPGTYELTADIKNEDYTSERKKVTLDAESESETIVIKLRSQPGIKGRVIFPEGEQLTGSRHFRVYAILKEGDAEISMSELLQGRQVSVTQYNNYQYTFKDLVPGNYRVGMVWGSEVCTVRVEVTDSVVSRDLILPSLSPEDYVLLRVLDPEGQPVKNCNISIGYGNISSSMFGSRGNIFKQPDGSYRVLYPDTGTGNQENSTCNVKVYSHKYGEKAATFQLPAPSELIIQFDPQAMLNTMVTDYGTTGYENQLGLKLFGKDEKNRYFHYYGLGSSVPDSEGKCVLGPVQPGEYDLVLFLKGNRNQYYPVSIISTPLVSGDNQKIVSLPSLYELTVILPEKNPGRYLMVRGKSVKNFNRYIPLRQGGEVIVKDLPAGEFEVMVSGKRKTILIPDETEVVFDE